MASMKHCGMVHLYCILKPPSRTGCRMANKLNAFLLSPFCHALVRQLERTVPPVRAWHRFAYEHHFSRSSRSERLYRGVYASFEEAVKAVPKTHGVGYNHPVAGSL